MAKAKDRKVQKAKARQEAIRKQKAVTTAQPRLLRQNPGLAEALSARHRLIGYYVNDNWADSHVASIHVIREAESGEVFAGFLVDLWWRGTKDAYGRFAELNVLEELRARLHANSPDRILVPLAPETAVNLIRGGVAWARRWHYPLPDDVDLWLRLVDPAPPWGLDLGVFGEGGERPIILGTPEDVARYEHLDLSDPGAFEMLEPDADADSLALGAGDLWVPEVAPVAPEPEAAGPGGLWLPPGAAPAAAPPALYLPDGTRHEVKRET